MNAAFLLVTTAWLAGADAPPRAPAPAGPAAPAPAATYYSNGTYYGNGGYYGNGWNGCCDGCSDGCGHRLFGHFRGLFHRHGGECCETACQPTCAPAPAPAPVCQPCPAPAPAAVCCDTGDTCCGGGGHRLFGFLHRHGCRQDTCNFDGCCGATTDCCDGGGHGHRLFGWLRGLCHRHRGCCDGGDACCTGGDACCNGSYYGQGHGVPPGTYIEPIGPPKEPAKKMPSDTGDKEKETYAPPPVLETAPKTSLAVEPETKNPFELHRRYESRVSHAPDYSWLTGQLFYVHADGGLWVLRYAPLWKEDPHGGSMVLARDIRMDSYREGDLVTIHGDIISQRSSVFLGGPLYRVQSIQLIEHNAD